MTPSPECESNPGPVNCGANGPAAIKRSREREDLASLGSDDSGILCGSDSGSSDNANVNTRFVFTVVLISYFSCFRSFFIIL